MSSATQLKKGNDISDDNNIGTLSKVEKNNFSCRDIGIQNFSSIICNIYTMCISDEGTVYSVGIVKSERNRGVCDDIKKYNLRPINNLTNIKMIDCYATSYMAECGVCKYICLKNDGKVCIVYLDKREALIGEFINKFDIPFIIQEINMPSCKQVCSGNDFALFLTDNNCLYYLISDGYGLIDIEDNNNIGVEYIVPQLVNDVINVEYVACGRGHSICKTYDNKYYSCGDNYSGQLGQGHRDCCSRFIECFNWPGDIISIKCGDEYSLLLTSKGYVYSFGSNYQGQLGLNDKNIKSRSVPTLIHNIPEITRIECGENHSMCIDIDNNLWVFGYNTYGQLGLGDTEDRYKPILHPTLTNIIDISSRGYSTFAKTLDNEIYAFGDNKYSQLGIKTIYKDTSVPVRTFINREYAWHSTMGKSKQKSARK